MTLWLLNYFVLQVFSIETSHSYPKKIPIFWGWGAQGEGPMRRAQNPSVPKTFYPKTPQEKKGQKGDTWFGIFLERLIWILSHPKPQKV
jgi:hypothetical protein